MRLSSLDVVFHALSKYEIKKLKNCRHQTETNKIPCFHSYIDLKTMKRFIFMQNKYDIRNKHQNLHRVTYILSKSRGKKRDFMYLKYDWSTVKYQWSTAEVQVKYRWSTTKYQWSTAEVPWGTTEVRTPEVSLFPPWSKCNFYQKTRAYPLLSFLSSTLSWGPPQVEFWVENIFC